MQSDPTELGPRKALNLGHTFGHAIEHATGFGTVPHGIAVALGLGLAVRASKTQGMLMQTDLEQRLMGLMQALGLPRSWSEWNDGKTSTLDSDALLKGLAQDKKGQVSKPRFVLPQALGKVQWDQEIEEQSLRAMFEDWLS